MRSDFEAAQAALVAAAARRARDRRVPARAGGRAISPRPIACRRRSSPSSAAAAGWKIAAITRRAAAHPGRAAADRLGASAGDAARRAASDRRRFVSPTSSRRRSSARSRFQLRRDLPPRPSEPYSRAEVARGDRGDAPGDRDRRSALAARAAARWPSSPTASATAPWSPGRASTTGRSIAFAEVDIVLTAAAPGRPAPELALGSARAILDGDPFATVVMLANAPAGGQPGPARRRHRHHRQLHRRAACSRSRPLPRRVQRPRRRSSCASNSAAQPIFVSPARKRLALPT